MEFPLGYTNWVIPITVPFPNTLSETINCKCKQSTVEQQKNSSTENWTSSVEKIEKTSFTMLRKTDKTISAIILQNAMSVILE